jgi:hypothetical protein
MDFFEGMSSSVIAERDRMRRTHMQRRQLIVR